MCSIENTLLSSLKVTVFEQSIIILLLLIMMMMTTERIKMPSLFMIFFMQLGFYILIFLGFINQLLFFPKFVAVNKRKVSGALLCFSLSSDNLKKYLILIN